MNKRGTAYLITALLTIQLMGGCTNANNTNNQVNNIEPKVEKIEETIKTEETKTTTKDTPSNQTSETSTGKDIAHSDMKDMILKAQYERQQNLEELTLGDSEYKVLNLLLTPDNESGAIWYYNDSEIHLGGINSKAQSRGVSGWIDKGEIKEVLPKKVKDGVIKYNSTIYDVFDIIGAPNMLITEKMNITGVPTKLDFGTMVYGASTIDITDDYFVVGWVNKGELDSILPEPKNTTELIDYGTTVDKVYEIMGAPEICSIYELYYGDSTIIIDSDGIVVEWDNQGELKVKE